MSDRPRLVLIPGFTQTASSWDAVLGALDEEVGGVIDAVALDVDVRDSFEATALALGAAGGRAVYAGYSMGGRLALALAAARPDLVAALALVSASPGIADPAERAARVRADEDLARVVEADGVAAFLDHWLARPMFAGVPADAPGLDDRRAVPAEVLAAQLRTLGTGAMEPLHDALDDLEMAVAVITGVDDDKFDAIGNQMFDRIGTAVRVRLAGGHAVPLEEPRGLARFLAAFARAPRPR